MAIKTQIITAAGCVFKSSKEEFVKTLRLYISVISVILYPSRESLARVKASAQALG
jgi:hypothetical protein